jgi:hypothetical protein
MLPVPNQMLPVPNQPAQSFATAPSVAAPLAPNQPAPQPAFGAWQNQPEAQRNTAAWSHQPASQEGQGSFGDWTNLRAPQQWSSAPATVEPARKRKGRGIVAWTLWVFAGGLFAAPQLTDYADQGVEAGVAWLAALAPSAPSFVRPYLPKPTEAPAQAPAAQRSRVEGSAPVVPTAVAPAVPVEATARAARKPEIAAQPARKPEIAAQPAGMNATAAAPSRALVADQRPARDPRPHAVRGKRGKIAVALPLDDAPAPVAEKTAAPKHGASVDPFEGGEGAAPATTRATKTAAEPTAVKSQPKSHDSLDDLMADGPGGGGKAHEKRSTSREIDAMLKDVQKSDPQPTPKRVEPASASASLTAADISRVMSGVKSNAAECGKRFGQSGVADLKLTVGKDGTLSGVAIRGQLADSPVGRCVVQAARNAVFPHSGGLTFNYRVDVR